jgi:hypothetical protein
MKGNFTMRSKNILSALLIIAVASAVCSAENTNKVDLKLRLKAGESHEIKMTQTQNMTSADGGPFDITKYDTFPTDWLNNDHERQTVVTQSHWGEGSADTEDWANPGHQ